MAVLFILLFINLSNQVTFLSLKYLGKHAIDLSITDHHVNIFNYVQEREVA